MALLINKNFFVGKINVPNIHSSNSQTGDELDYFIDFYETYLLKNTLGFILYNELKLNILDGAVLPTAPQKWKDLVNGKEYTKDNEVRVWNGLIYETGTLKQSIIADFIYFKWFTERNRNTGAGVTQIEVKNAIIENPTIHLVTIFNTFVNDYFGNIKNINLKVSYQNDVPFYDWYATNESVSVGLIEFLNDFETDFIGFKALDFNYINRFSL